MDEQELSRRQFFRRGISKAATTGMDVLERRAQEKARHWIRPPFALPELDFLLACTRCNACVEACPHQVIFPLPLSRGTEVAATPALDLLNKGCHLCEGWPCVQACADQALVLDGALCAPDGAAERGVDELDGSEHDTIDLPEVQVLPKLAFVEIDTAACLPYSGPECGACKGSCPVPDTLQWHNEKPTINHDTCTGCALCREACIVEPKAVIVNSRDQ